MVVLGPRVSIILKVPPDWGVWVAAVVLEGAVVLVVEAVGAVEAAGLEAGVEELTAVVLVVEDEVVEEDEVLLQAVMRKDKTKMSDNGTRNFFKLTS
jgi:hypothetical protein